MPLWIFIGSSNIGDELTISIYRQGENLTITITVGEQIQSALAKEENQQPQTMPQGQFVQHSYLYPISCLVKRGSLGGQLEA